MADDKKKETPREHFVRLAEVRTNGVIEWLDKLARLNNKNLYEYSDEDVTKIEEALNQRLADTIATLKGEKNAKRGFSL